MSSLSSVRSVPGQVGDPVEVVAGDAELGALRGDLGEARHLLLGDLVGVGRQVRALEATAEVLELVLLVALAELVTDGLHLLAQDVLALRLAHLLLDHGGDLLLHLHHLELPRDDLQHELDPRLDVERLEHLLLVLDRGELGGEVARDEVGERARLAHVVEDARGLARQIGLVLEHLAGGLAEGGREGVELDVAVEAVVQALDAGPHVGLEAERLEHAHARRALQHDRIRARAHADDLDDLGEHADLVEIAERGLLDVGLALGGDRDVRPLTAEQLLDQPHAARPAHVDGHHLRGVEHRVPQRQNRQGVEITRTFLGAHLDRVPRPGRQGESKSRASSALSRRTSGETARRAGRPVDGLHPPAATEMTNGCPWP